MNKRCLFSLAIILGVVFALPIAAQAYQNTTQKNALTPTHAPLNNHTPATPGAHAIVETYDVISVNDDIQVVAKSDLLKQQKQIKEENAQELKKYQQDLKDKNKSNLKKPVEKKLTVLKSNFKNQDDAKKWADDKIKEPKKAGPKKSAAY